jgi:hypothetical protein
MASDDPVFKFDTIQGQGWLQLGTEHWVLRTDTTKSHYTHKLAQALPWSLIDELEPWLRATIDDLREQTREHRLTLAESEDSNAISRAGQEIGFLTKRMAQAQSLLASIGARRAENSDLT